MFEKFEDLIHEIIDKYLFHIGMVIIFAITLLIRYHLAPITCLSGDYLESLVPWVEYYRKNGIMQGLAQSMGSYYVPYNLFLAIIAFLPGEPWVYIAGTSVLCDYIGAFYIYLLLKEICGQTKEGCRKAFVAALVTLLLPASIMNGSLWKQCDSVYSCFVIMSLYYLIKERYGKSLFVLGIGFIFKLQAIYLLPVHIIAYIVKKRGLSIFHFFWIPGMYLIGGLPAVFAGRRIMDVYDCYYHQANYNGFNGMQMGMPNIYALGLSDYPALNIPALLVTVCVFVFLAYILQKYPKGLNKENFVYLAAWCLWACIMFLPAQHERYNFPAIILLTAFYLAVDVRKSWPAIVINIISCFQYGNYLFKAEMPEYTWIAVFHIAAFAYVSYDMYRCIKQRHEQCVQECEDE